MTGVEGEVPRFDVDRLASIATLAAGPHDGRGDAMCAVEAVAYITRQPPSDRPAGVSRVIASFVRTWNDGLAQPARDALILPLLPRLVATAGTNDLENARAAMAADWLLRVHAPAWFRRAALNVEGDELACLPKLTRVADLAAHCDHLERARKRAAVANLTLRQTGSPVRSAAWDASQRAAWLTIHDALEAAGSRVLAAGWDLSYAAAYAAARAVGKVPLELTRLMLQDSAGDLVARMIDARAPSAPGASDLSAWTEPRPPAP